MMVFLDKSWKNSPDTLALGKNGAAIALLGLWTSLRLLRITVPIAPVPFALRVYITPDPLLQRQLAYHGAPSSSAGVLSSSTLRRFGPAFHQKE